MLGCTEQNVWKKQLKGGKTSLAHFVSESSVYHGGEKMKTPHAMLWQWGQAVKAVLTMVGQEVESNTGTLNPPAGSTSIS